MPFVEHKAQWALKWISADAPFAMHLIAFAVVEGVFFSGSFAVIFWFKSRGLMPGLTFLNELIAWDKGLHTTFAYMLYNVLGYHVEPSAIYAVVQDTIGIECQFWDGT